MTQDKMITEASRIKEYLRLDEDIRVTLEPERFAYILTVAWDGTEINTSVAHDLISNLDDAALEEIKSKILLGVGELIHTTPGAGQIRILNREA